MSTPTAKVKQMPTKTVPKAKLPAKISIFGKEFKVIRCLMKEDDYGEMIGHDAEIKVLSTLTPDLARKTLVHEVIHAALHTGGLSMLLEGLGGEKLDIEEAVVICLENALHHAIDLEKLRVD